VKTSDNDDWRTRYFDTLGLLERERQRFEAVESALKRIAGRLCTAALGQSPRLDAEIKELQAALRGALDGGELERLTPALTAAIQALDNVRPVSPPAQTTVVGSDDECLRATFAALLVQVRNDADLTARAAALEAQLGTVLTRDRCADLVAALTELVGQRISRLERDKHEIAGLLSHLAGRLDEIGRFVAEQGRSQVESQASSETLNAHLAGEMKAMGESVDAADDLLQIRAQVHRRLESIDRHVQDFRQREAVLSSAVRERSEQMRGRISELEAEAQRLQNQLEDEQRLATIDSLTRIPNRLAYEKRVDEEIKRWHRFKQPTCLAVWDVDHFKGINDNYGHRAGDRVLRAVAECLSKRVRSTDLLARYGGEEFVMILPGTTLDDAAHAIDDMRASIAKIGFHCRGAPVSVTMSIGLTALLPTDTAGAAFDRADQALYRAKQSGRNRCVCA